MKRSNQANQIKKNNREVWPYFNPKTVVIATSDYLCDRCQQKIEKGAKMKVSLPRWGFDGNQHSNIYRRHFGVRCEKSYL